MICSIHFIYRYRHQFGEVYDSITARLGPDPNQHPGGSRKCKIWDRYVRDVQKEANRRKHSGKIPDVSAFEATMYEIGEGRFDDCSCNNAAIGRWWNQVRLSQVREFRFYYCRQA